VALFSWLITLGVLPVGKDAYATTLSRSGGTTYIVKKETYTLDEENNFIWVEEEEVFKAVIEKKSFASGKMKNIYKISYPCRSPWLESSHHKVQMLIAGLSYAAKSFYNIGNEDGSAPTKSQNLSHLKEELLHQMVASQCVERFCEAAKKSICSKHIIFHSYTLE
jgi:hypothetical protein